MARDRKTRRSDLLAGAVYAALFAALAFGPARVWLYSLEARFFDRLTTQAPGEPDDRLTIVAIDDQSVRNIGRFPFSRDIVATVIDTLSAGGAETIVSTLAFPEPQVDAGADYLRDVDEALARLGTDAASLADLKAQVTGAIEAIDYDRRLADSLTNAGNVLLPLLPEDPRVATVGTPLARGHNELNGLEGDYTGIAAEIESALLPLPTLARAAAGLGHLAHSPDRDGITRGVPVVLSYRDHAVPSLALVTALRMRGLDPSDLTFQSADHVLAAGRMTLPVGDDGVMLTRFYPTTSLRIESFYDVFTGAVPSASFRGQTVLIGPTAAGIGDALATPGQVNMAPVEFLAQTVSALTTGEVFTTMPQSTPVRAAIFTVILLFLWFALPRLGPAAGTVITVSAAGAFLLIEAIFISGYALWLPLITPVLFLLGGFVLVTVRRYGLTERLKLQSEADSAESNRLLGLAFQSQGQLDIAFEKFSRCPLDDTLLEPLYNLGLDFERRRQFGKAGAVYRRITEHDAAYRDVAARIRRNERLDETLIMGTQGGTGASLLLDDDDSVQNPMLGRYVIEKELGKGAMGTVYLGRDPKINRVVAIKTIALSQEFDENEIASVRERFFREAETAGRLNHPDIVTVYDAGEEHDLAYIAMEFLKGTHLSSFTKTGHLLPTESTIELMARVADALAYAHKEDVVHRDIKPANIMYDSASNELKITDFGIARITSSSKTKTGIVLGTPSYMSPEQLAGKNVNGHSDLFSVGVTLYQLLTGQLPFRADSMATLMYKIANEPHTPLRAVRPDLSEALGDVVDRALCKDVAERYASGATLAHDLRRCAPSQAA